MSSALTETDEQIRARLSAAGIEVSGQELAEIATVARHLLVQAERLSGPLPLGLEPVQIQLPPRNAAGEVW